MNGSIFDLRAAELGLHKEDLEDLTIGMVMDMVTEKSNDECTYDVVATQEDFDKFTNS